MTPDRDRILEDALKQELRATTAPLTDGCLDAETLAAWEDGGLDAVAMQTVELHVSTCSRCQSMAAASARGLAGQQAGRPAEASAPATFSLWRWWLAPLAAGAAAVTLWMVVPAQREIAEAPPQPAAAVAAPALEVQAPTPLRPAEAPAPSEPLRDAGRVDSSAKAAAADRQRTQQQDAAAPKAVEARKEQAPASLAETVTVGAVAAAQPPPAAATPAPIPMAPPAPPSPAAPVRPAERAAANAASADLQRRAQFAFAPIEIISPAPAQRWRVTATGIERSTDAGGTWSLVRATSGETITAGTSSTPAVCWLIGNNGLVLLTTNGTVFTRIDIPDAGNLRSIAAPDERSATVVNAAGRTFRTDDGGRTWR